MFYNFANLSLSGNTFLVENEDVFFSRIGKPLVYT